MRERSVLLAHSTRFKRNPQQLKTFAIEVALKALAHKASQLALTDRLSRQAQQSDTPVHTNSSVHAQPENKTIRFAH